MRVSVREMRVTAIVVLLFLAGCSGTSGNASENIREDDVPAASTPAGSALIPFLDPDADLGLFSQSWILSNDPLALAEASDVVFVGRIVGVERQVYVDEPTEEDIADAASITYDGIKFEVVEVLRGRMQDSTKATISHPAQISGPRLGEPLGEPIALSVEPIDLVRDSLTDVSQGRVSDLFLVFGLQATPGLVFNTPGGVVLLNDDGSLRSGVASPFGNIENMQLTLGTKMSLDFVRDWINGKEPVLVVPEDAKPTAAEAPKPAK